MKNHSVFHYEDYGCLIEIHKAEENGERKGFVRVTPLDSCEPRFFVMECENMDMIRRQIPQLVAAAKLPLPDEDFDPLAGSYLV